MELHDDSAVEEPAITSPDTKIAATPKRHISDTVQRVKRQSEQAYENSIWCCSCRAIMNFPKKWPRVCAVFFGMIVPLWCLILLAAGFGSILARVESSTEIESNDAIIAERRIIQRTSEVDDLLLELPTYCLSKYFEEILKNQSAPDAFGLFVEDLQQAHNAVANLTDNSSSNSTTSNTISEEFVDNLIEELSVVSFADIRDFVEECSQDFVGPAERAQQIRENATGAFDDFSFNWNRCWPNELREENWLIFYPSRELIVASRPEEQEATFIAEWDKVQQEIYQDLLESLPPNATDDDIYEAFLTSVDEASGGGSCDFNIGGTVWFFFTVMTTVGYGNQAPVTDEGRALIYTAGLASLILFGAVLGTSGYVLLTIFDDCVSRFWLSKFLKNPLVGVILWGAIWLWWAVLIATDTQWWWEARLPDFDADRFDALWFAYISTSTIGLGDYFLQPEVMFGSDALRFSITFLVGFIFLATFFGKIVESVGRYVPGINGDLEARLKVTPVITCWEKSYFGFCERQNADSTEAENDQKQEEDKLTMLAPEAIQKRINTLRSLATNEETEQTKEQEEEEGEPGESTLDTMELIREEERILNDLLSMVKEKRYRAMRVELEDEEEYERNLPTEGDEKEQIGDSGKEEMVGSSSVDPAQQLIAEFAFDSPRAQVAGENATEEEKESEGCIVM